MDKFLLEIKKKYDLEDFTGNLSVILGDDSSFESFAEYAKAEVGAQKFIKDIYNMAVKYLSGDSNAQIQKE